MIETHIYSATKHKGRTKQTERQQDKEKKPKSILAKGTPHHHPLSFTATVEKP